MGLTAEEIKEELGLAYGPLKESLSTEEVTSRFGKHAASIEGPNPNEERHQDLREMFMVMAISLDALLPNGRAKNVMFTELESASMWAHKTLAVGE